MSWVVAIIVGAIIGLIASSLTGNREGLIGMILIGILGSVLAKWLFADVLGIGGAASAGSFSLLGLFWGVVGAVVLILILRALGIMR